MNKRKGFTLIEIALFLAITAALFIGIALGMQNSIFQQRYNDSVQSFFEYMRSVYSKVANPQSPGSGNSNEAIYGKLVVFGQKKDLQNQDIDYAESSPIFSYDVVGKADNTSTLGTGTVIKLLNEEQVNAIRFTLNQDGTIKSKELASPEKFEPRWQAAIENTNVNREIYKGAIMVVRHPRSGVINTLVLNKTIEVNQIYNDNNISDIKNLLVQYLDSGEFATQEVDFCVNPYGQGNGGAAPRQNIRIINNARNASGVELVDLDGGDNRCS